MTGLELDMGAEMVVPPIALKERAAALETLARHDALDLAEMVLGDEGVGNR